MAILIDTLAGGGAEKVVMSLAGQLVRLGHNVELVVLKKRSEYQLPDTYPIHFLYDNPKTKLNGLWGRQKHASKLQSLITKLEQEKGKFELYVSNLEDCHYIVAACGFLPCFYVMHNSVEETLIRTKKLGPIKYWKFARSLSSLGGKNLITVSKGIEGEILAAKRIVPASVITIYNPFDIEGIRKMADEGDEALPADKYIIHVGRFARQKRHDILFEAFKQVPTEYKLVCLCGKSDKLLKLAEKMGISDRIIVPGFTQNPYQWIKQAELLVLSSDFEGLSTVLIESIICATLAVSTDCPHGADEILSDGLEYWIVPRRNPKLLGKKICEALAINIDLSQATIIDKVRAEDIALQYLALIEE